jgi:hypothetical protein
MGMHSKFKIDRRRVNAKAHSRLGVSSRLLLLLLTIAMSAAQAHSASYKEIEVAVRSEDLAQLETVLGTDGGVKSDTGALCLMVSALWNKPAIAEKLLAKGVSVNASPTYSREAGETPLTYALFGDHEDMLAFLLARGANPNYRGDCGVRNCRGIMPLDLAVKCGFLGAARRLLEAGADPNAGQNFAVETANQRGDVKMCELLLAHGGRLPGQNQKDGAIEAKTKPEDRATANAVRDLGLAQLLPEAARARASSEARTRCRLAIIADDDTLAAGDVLAARLSAQSAVELVERQEIDKLLAEKQLTREFAAQDANYDRVAAWLRADALLLIRLRDLSGTKAVEARFIRVYPGIVLDTVYSGAPLADVKSWAGEMAIRVLGLAGKAVREEAISLSVLDVHAALPTPVTVGLERTLTVLLRDRLVHDPQFIVLERAEMEKVAFENAGEKPFWTGSYLVDPLVDPSLDNSGKFTLAVRLQPHGNRAVINAKVSGTRSEPARAIDDLIAQIHRQLGGPATTPPRRDLTAEANSYLEEARWALAARMPARAEAAAEVTWALGLQNLEVARLRVRSAEEAALDAVSRRQTPSGAPAAEALDFAIQAVGVWDDALQGSLLREYPGEVRPWLDSITNLTEVVTMAVISVGPATEQIQQAERMGVLRSIYWSALNDAFNQSRTLSQNSGLPEMMSQIQLAMARIILPDANELQAALRELLSRDFATSNTLTRAQLRLSLQWLPSMNRRAETYLGPRQIEYFYPNNEAVRRQLLESLRKSPAPEDHFLASAIEFGAPVIMPAAHSARLMEEFWGMREVLAQDGELCKLYFGRLHGLIGNEPIRGDVYVPRTYRLTLPQDESADKESRNMTQFEFYRRLYLFLVSHTTRPQPAFDDLVRRYLYRYSPQQKDELQQATSQYAARTGASPSSFSPSEGERGPFSRSVRSDNAVRERFGDSQYAGRTGTPPTAAPDTLPPLQVSKLWHPFDLGRDISSDFVFAPSSMLWAEGRLWFEGSVHDFDSKPQVMHHYIFAVELPTMRTEVIELSAITIIPQGPGAQVPHGVRFAVRPDCLAVTASHDFFALYDRAARRWQTYPELQPARVERPEIIGDLAYFIVEDNSAVMSFDLKQRSTKLLVSTRRKPAASPLDDPALWLNQIWKNEANELMAVAESDHNVYLKVKSVVQAWSPSAGTWRLVEGPVRSLKTPRPSTSHGRLAISPFLAQSGLEVAGEASAAGRAPGSGFALRLFNQAKPFDRIPMVILPETSLRLPDNRYGRQNLTVQLCYESPAGYILPPSPGAGFWFLPKKDFEGYLQRARRPVETTQR